MEETPVALWPGPQQDFYRAVTTNRRATRFLFIGGAQSGKTEAGRWCFTAKVLERIASGVPGRAWIVAPDYILADRAKRAFEATIPREYILHGAGREGRYVWQLVNEVCVELRTAKHPQQLRAEDLFCVWFDEMSRASEDAYLNLTTRLARWNGPLIVTTTPCIAESPWLNDEYDKYCNDAEYVWVNSRIDDNKAISRAAIAERRRRFPDQYGAEELDGQFIRSREGLVYGKVWDAKVHIIEEYEPVETDETVVGCDSGFNHPWAYLRFALHKDGGTTLFEELSGSDLAPSDQAQLAKADVETEARTLRRWFDPSAALVRAEFHKAGLITRQAKNAVEDGVRACYARLKARGPDGEPSFRVVRACHGFIREIGLYRYKKGNEHRPSEAVEKIHDDRMDAWRYEEFSEGRSPSIIGVTAHKAKAAAAKPYIEVKEGRTYLCGQVQDFSDGTKKKSGYAGRSWCN